MPLQNRVTPFGDILAIPQRGLFIGNRGIIHDPATKTLTRTRWTTKAWLVCTLHYKNIRRKVMGGRSWTELFFLDEAVALAAGHRPCFECRREAAERFRAAWAKGTGGAVPKAGEMDAVLQGERLDGRTKRFHRLPNRDLPDGSMVAADGEAFLIAYGHAWRWTSGAYERAKRIPAMDALLTPPSTVRALAAGYAPVLHESVRE